MKKILFIALMAFVISSCSEDTSERKVVANFDVLTNNPSSTEIVEDGGINEQGTQAEISKGIESIKIKHVGGSFLVYPYAELEAGKDLSMPGLPLGENSFIATAYQNNIADSDFTSFYAIDIPEDALIRVGESNSFTESAKNKLNEYLKTLTIYKKFIGKSGIVSFSKLEEHVNIHMENESALGLFKFNVKNVPEGYYVKVNAVLLHDSSDIDKEEFTSVNRDYSRHYIFNPKQFLEHSSVSFKVDLYKNGNDIPVRTSSNTNAVLSNVTRNSVNYLKMNIDCDDIKTTGDFIITWETSFEIFNWSLIDIHSW